MSAQLLPALSQRRHWSASVGVGRPLHVPGEAVSVCPSAGVPLMAGRALLVGATAGSITSCGRWDALPSLLATCSPAVFVVVNANEYVPLAGTSDVTLIGTQMPLAKGPDDPVTAEDIGGAFCHVRIDSLQLLSATERTSKPTASAVSGHRRSVAPPTGPVRPET